MEDEGQLSLLYKEQLTMANNTGRALTTALGMDSS